MGEFFGSCYPETRLVERRLRSGHSLLRTVPRLELGRRRVRQQLHFDQHAIRGRAPLDSDRRVLATIARKGGGFIAEVKRLGDAELWEVTARSRELLPERVLAWVRGQG